MESLREVSRAGAKPARKGGRLRALAATVLSVAAAAVACGSDTPIDPEEPVALVPGKKWSTLHLVPPKATNAIIRLPEKGPLFPINDLALTGPKPGDKYWLGDFKSEAEWGTDRNGLFVTKGQDAALLLASAQNFELEGTILGDGLGGWFMLVGWKDQHGHLLTNVTLKKNSAWQYMEMRGAAAVGDTFREVSKYDWKGLQPFRLTVDKGKLDLRVGKDEVLKELELPNYHEGQILIGTYKTPYGAKPIRIQSLRIRAK